MSGEPEIFAEVDSADPGAAEESGDEAPGGGEEATPGAEKR